VPVRPQGAEKSGQEGGDERRKYIGRLMGHLAGFAATWTGFFGHHLGFFKTLTAEPRGLTAAELASRSGCDVRYVETWCRAAFAAEFLTCRARTGRFSLNPLASPFLTDEMAPVYFPAFAYLWVAVAPSPVRLVSLLPSSSSGRPSPTRPASPRTCLASPARRTSCTSGPSGSMGSATARTSS